MLTLGIETSCDETAVAVTDGKKILSNKISSSIHLFSKWGGVIPEMASRYHIEYINQVLKEALEEAGISLKDIKLIAVTQGPGLVGALLIGISFAKSLSFALGIPLIGVNHLIAHLYSNIIQNNAPSFPFVGLIISGGHTSLFYVRDSDNYSLLGQTQDDAIGESYDKVAKILGLGYPGGPIIEKRAKKGDSAHIKFPCSKLKKDSLDFSFSGIKTAVLYYTRENLETIESEKQRSTIINNISASFQEAASDMVIEKTIKSCIKKGVSEIVVGGGVSANLRFREKLKIEADKLGLKVFFPPKGLCMDNAAMVAGLGESLYKKGHSSDLSLTAEPNMPF